MRLVLLMIVSIVSPVFCQSIENPSAETFDYRDWTSKTGSKVNAKLIEFDKGVVSLGKLDGSIVKLPVDQLSKTDQAFCHWITKLAASRQAAKAENPQVVYDAVDSVSQAFSEMQQEVEQIAGSDLTTAAKFIAWDKAVGSLVLSIASLPKTSMPITVTVTDAQQVDGGFVINGVLHEMGYATTLQGKGLPQELASLKSGDVIQYRVSVTPSPKLQLRSTLTLPWIDPDTDLIFYRQYQQIAPMIKQEGLVIPFHATSFTKLKST